MKECAVSRAFYDNLPNVGTRCRTKCRSNLECFYHSLFRKHLTCPENFVYNLWRNYDNEGYCLALLHLSLFHQRSVSARKMLVGRIARLDATPAKETKAGDSKLVTQKYSIRSQRESQPFNAVRAVGGTGERLDYHSHLADGLPMLTLKATLKTIP